VRFCQYWDDKIKITKSQSELLSPNWATSA
jgi:hypothetical protein